MDPESVKEGKKYRVSFKDGERSLKLHHKIEYRVKGKGSYWYFLFEKEEGEGFVHVKTNRRVLGSVDE